MNMSRPILLLALPFALMLAAPGAQAACTAAARSYISAGLANQSQLDAKGQDYIVQQMVQHPPTGLMGSDGISNCVAQNWPSMFPGASSILIGVGQQIVNQICTKAREKVAENTPSYLSTIYSSVQNSQIPTGSFGSGIPGVPANIPMNALPAGVPQVPVVPPSSSLGDLFGGGNGGGNQL